MNPPIQKGFTLPPSPPESSNCEKFLAGDCLLTLFSLEDHKLLTARKPVWEAEDSDFRNWAAGTIGDRDKWCCMARQKQKGKTVRGRHAQNCLADQDYVDPISTPGSSLVWYGDLISMGFLGDSDGKESAYNVGDPGSIPGSGRSPGEGNGNLLSILVWRIPWTEEPGRLQSMGSQRVRRD